MKKFAVKEIPMRNPVFTDVLENEIKILSTLNHKNSSLTLVGKQRDDFLFQLLRITVR